MVGRARGPYGSVRRASARAGSAPCGPSRRRRPGRTRARRRTTRGWSRPRPGQRALRRPRPRRRAGVVEAAVHHQHRLGDVVEVRPRRDALPEGRVVVGQAVPAAEAGLQLGQRCVGPLELREVLRLQARHRCPADARGEQPGLRDERLHHHATTHRPAEERDAVGVDAHVVGAAQRTRRGDRVRGVAEADRLLDARVVGRLGVVAVVDVQRDVAPLGEEAALAGHPLPADVVGRVDVAVREHHGRPSLTTGSAPGRHVEDAADPQRRRPPAGGGRAEGDVVRRVGGRALADRAEPQVAAGEVGGRQGGHRDRGRRLLGRLLGGLLGGLLRRLLGRARRVGEGDSDCEDSAGAGGASCPPASPSRRRAGAGSQECRCAATPGAVHADPVCATTR